MSAVSKAATHFFPSFLTLLDYELVLQRHFTDKKTVSEGLGHRPRCFMVEGTALGPGMSDSQGHAFKAVALSDLRWLLSTV